MNEQKHTRNFALKRELNYFMSICTKREITNYFHLGKLPNYRKRGTNLREVLCNRVT